jgi:hypothetical protein
LQSKDWSVGDVSYLEDIFKQLKGEIKLLKIELDESILLQSLGRLDISRIDLMDDFLDPLMNMQWDCFEIDGAYCA